MAYGSMYNFSISDFIYDINPELLIFAATFLIFTAFIRFALLRTILKESQSTASIIAICAGLLASYGLVKSEISFRFLNSINLGPEFLVNVLPWLILLLAAGVIIKWGLGILLIIFGAILAIAGFADLIYARGFGIGVGILLILIGLALLKKHRQKVGRGLGHVGRAAWKGAKYAGKEAWKGAKYVGSKNYRYEQTKNRRRRKATKRRIKNKREQDYERHQNAKLRLRRMRSRPKYTGPGYAEIARNKEKAERERIEAQQKEEERIRKEKEEWRWQEEQKKAQRKQEKADRERQQEEQRQRNNAQRQQRQANDEQRKNDLARKIGIKNLERTKDQLQRDLRQGYSNAKNLHVQMNKELRGLKKGDPNYQASRPAYRAWYRQYNWNIEAEKRLKEIEDRIKHLRNQLN